MNQPRFLVLSVIIPVVVSLFICCKGDKTSVQQEEIIALEKEVLHIHDEVMPKMSDIAKLMEILEKESLNPNLDSLLRQDIANTMTTLAAGDSLMWEWMHHYAKPEEAPLDSIKSYLLTEKARISTVKDIMLDGIKNAESLVQKLGHGQPN